MERIHSYPSIYNLGHPAVEDIFNDPVLVEEKVDGSQFSFGVVNGELRVRSKGKQMVVDAPEPMFALAVETAKRLAPDLKPEWVYRGEFLQKPKHNTLAYGRVPFDHIILFDVCPALETYLPPSEKAEEAGRLGLECVPSFRVDVSSLDEIKALTERESCLGGVAMEGVVFKNYARFTKDKKAMMAKYVREAFREAHAVEWKASNPTRTDIVQALITSLRTEARWEKAVQHLRESGMLTDSPQDIGPLLKEVPADILKECRETIMEKLFEHAWPQIRRGVTAGFPEWYKEKLAASQFEAAP